MRMHKWVASAQVDTTLGFEVSGEKHPNWFGLDEEAQKSPTVITIDSLERASDVLPTLEGASQDAS